MSENLILSKCPGSEVLRKIVEWLESWNRRIGRHKIPKEQWQKRRNEKQTSFSVMPCAIWKLSGIVVLVTAFQNFLGSCFRNNLFYGSLKKSRSSLTTVVCGKYSNGTKIPMFISIGSAPNLPYVPWYIYMYFNTSIFSPLLDGNFLWAQHSFSL